MRRTLWNEAIGAREARRRFWILSDLQQSDPRQAERCMKIGVEDFLSLKLDVDAICYLGDTTEGCVLSHLNEMADMQVRELARVSAPIYYALGNHEFDYHRHVEGAKGPTIPMRARVLREPQWHTTASPADWTFSADFGEIALFFLSDRCDPADPSWVPTHCGVRDVRDAAIGAHDFDADIEAVKREMAAIDKPFFSLSHYSFPGGNRDGEGPLQAALLPLPQNLMAHFYGHAHIGDFVWAGQNALRQVSTVTGSRITQFDIASFENVRGSTVRSALLEWYGDSSYGVFFRDHVGHIWEKAFFETPPA